MRACWHPRPRGSRLATEYCARCCTTTELAFVPAAVGSRFHSPAECNQISTSKNSADLQSHCARGRKHQQGSVRPAWQLERCKPIHMYRPNAVRTALQSRAKLESVLHLRMIRGLVLSGHSVKQRL